MVSISILESCDQSFHKAFIIVLPTFVCGNMTFSSFFIVFLVKLTLFYNFFAEKGDLISISGRKTVSFLVLPLFFSQHSNKTTKSIFPLGGKRLCTQWKKLDATVCVNRRSIFNPNTYCSTFAALRKINNYNMCSSTRQTENQLRGYMFFSYR